MLRISHGWTFDWFKSRFLDNHRLLNRIRKCWQFRKESGVQVLHFCSTSHWRILPVNLEILSRFAHLHQSVGSFICFVVVELRTGVGFASAITWRQRHESLHFNWFQALSKGRHTCTSPLDANAGLAVSALTTHSPCACVLSARMC